MLIETTRRYLLTPNAPEGSPERRTTDAIASAVRAYGVRKLARSVGKSAQLFSFWLAGERLLLPDTWHAVAGILRLDEATGFPLPPEAPRSLPATSNPDEPIRF